MAIAQKINATITALRRLPCELATNNGTRMKKPRKPRYARKLRSLRTRAGAKTGLKAMRPITAVKIKPASASKKTRLAKEAESTSTQSRITGVMISVAVPSASHSFAHWIRELAKSDSFATREATSAAAELMTATGRKAINENIATLRAVVKRLAGVDQRFVKNAPVNPAMSVPMAIKLASDIG